MTQNSATIERASAAAYDAFDGPMLLRAADVAHYDEDAVMDAWLASLDPREFELILTRLADDDARGSNGLEFSA
jgi:hypothetical protein